MALLPETFKAFQFQSGLEIVRSAFRASIATMTEANERAKQAHMDYAMSGEDDSEYEDGALVRSTLHELSYAELEASIAVRVVREAFIMSAFHYWERSARGWTGLHGKRQNFPDLRDAVSKQYTLHPRLEHLNTLNNLLKHNSQEKAEQLFIDWPEVFRPPFQSATQKAGLIPILSISDYHVEEAFEAVSASGPQYETP